MTQALRLDVDVDRVRSAFASLRRRIAAELGHAWEQIGARVDEVSSPLVPVLTGALVDDLKTRTTFDGMTKGSSLPYAGVQDRGWPAHNIAGHHFMDKAEEALPGAAVAEIAPAIQRLIDSVGLG